MKLTKTQQELMDEAKERIDTARKYKNFEDYFNNEEAHRFNKLYNTPEKFRTNAPSGWKRFEQRWKREKQAVIDIRCNSKTMKKLESLGLIQIIYDSTGDCQGLDTIKVLNY